MDRTTGCYHNARAALCYPAKPDRSWSNLYSYLNPIAHTLSYRAAANYSYGEPRSSGCTYDLNHGYSNNCTTPGYPHPAAHSYAFAHCDGHAPAAHSHVAALAYGDANGDTECHSDGSSVIHYCSCNLNRNSANAGSHLYAQAHCYCHP